VLSTAGRDEEAARTLHETLEFLPDSALAHVWLGTLAERANRAADARHELEQAAESVTSGRGAFFASVGSLASAAGDFPAAIDAFTRSIAARPNDPGTHTRFARALLQQDRVDEAFRELVAAVLVDPRDAGAHLGIGQILLNTGHVEDAVTALRRALQLVPGYTEARYALATALSRLGRTSESAQEFDRVQQAQRQETADRRRAMALATIKEEAALRTAEGDYDRAAALWQQAIEREPNQASNHIDFAAMLLRAGRVEQAIEHYERALTFGADPLVYRRLAELYSSLGRSEDAARARAAYTRALQRNVTSGSTP
jgi:superkiller protein 3